MRALLSAAAIALLAAAGAAGCGREDLARGRPVRASSVRIGDPAGVVNGVVEWGSYALHTDSGSRAWVAVDLGREVRVGEVRVFNRGDGFYDTRSANVGVEVSTDGRSFRRIGGCTQIFTQVSPCSVTSPGAPARHVRLVHPSALVLSEVEVYEAR